MPDMDARQHAGCIRGYPLLLSRRSYSPDTPYIVGSGDDDVEVEHVAKLKYRIESIAFAPESVLAVGTTVSLIKFPEEIHTSTRPLPFDTSLACAISGCGSKAITTQIPSEVRLWKTEPLECFLKVASSIKSEVSSCWISKDGASAIAVFADGNQSEIFYFEWIMGQRFPKLVHTRNVAKSIRNVSISEQLGIAVFVEKGALPNKIVVAQSYTQIGTMNKRKPLYNAGRSTPDICISESTPLCTVTMETGVHVLSCDGDFNNGFVLAKTSRRSSRKFSAISSDGKRAFVRSLEGVIQLWNVPNRCMIGSILLPRGNTAIAMSLSADGNQMVFVDNRNNVWKLGLAEIYGYSPSPPVSLNVLNRFPGLRGISRVSHSRRLSEVFRELEISNRNFERQNAAPTGCCASEIEKEIESIKRQIQLSPHLNNSIIPRLNILKTMVQEMNQNEKSNNVDNSASATCVIDLEEIKAGDRVIRLGCNHVYHKGCMWEYINTDENAKCPVCRRKVSRVFGLAVHEWTWRGDHSDKTRGLFGIRN